MLNGAMYNRSISTEQVNLGVKILVFGGVAIKSRTAQIVHFNEIFFATFSFLQKIYGRTT